MRSTLDTTLAWWIAGPIVGLVIVTLLAVGNKRFGVVGGVTDLVDGSAEGHGLRSWRTLLVVGIVLGGLVYAVLAGAPDAGAGYSWLDAHLSTRAEVAVLFGAFVVAAGVVLGVAVQPRLARLGEQLRGTAPAVPAREVL